MTEEHTHYSPPFHNEATYLCTSVDDDLARPALGPRDSFLLAHGRVADVAGVACGPAVIVAVVSRERRVVDVVLVEDGTTLIVGRHARCGLRLSSRRVALRQLALLVRAEGDAVVTRLWDLNTGAPCVTEDGQETAALIADGPAYVAFHGHALWMLPASVMAGLPERAAAAWEELPRRAFIDRRPPDPAARPAQRQVPSTPLPPRGAPGAGGGPARGDRAVPVEEISHVTLVGPPLVLGDPNDVEVGWGAVRIDYAGRRRRHPVSAERLDRGLLIGRYDRCGLEIAETHVSRVHALLVKIGADVWILDTASTNGLFHNGARITAAVLADVDTLSLGDGAVLDWRRQKHADA